MEQTTLPTPGRVLAIVIRHGHTDSNDPKNPVIRALDDIPLNRQGELDAEIAASQVAKYNPKIVYHSTLTRDSQMGAIISSKLGIAAEPDMGLLTADMGEWNGQPEKSVAPYILKWYQNPWEPSPGGESFNHFQSVLFPCVDAKLELARLSEAYRPMVIVTHGRPIAALDYRYRRILPEKALMPLPGGVALIKEGTYDDKMEFLTATEPILADV